MLKHHYVAEIYFLPEAVVHLYVWLKYVDPIVQSGFV